MEKIQLKICYSEEEANEFLKTIDANAIKSIEHSVKQITEGGQEYDQDGDLRYTTHSRTKVVIMIQYYVTDYTPPEYTYIPVRTKLWKQIQFGNQSLAQEKF